MSPQAPPEGSNAGQSKGLFTRISQTFSNRRSVMMRRENRNRTELAEHKAGSRLAKEKKMMRTFSYLLVATAVCSSTLSFLIDQSGSVIGRTRASFTSAGGLALGGAVAFNVSLALAARLLVRTTVEAEGSGFPEMKAMLFGNLLYKYLARRVLLVKATALVLVEAAGLPIGKEGPNVHLAACIAYSLDPSFFKSQQTDWFGHGDTRQEGAQNDGGETRDVGLSSPAVTRLLLAACAVGVGSTFSAPIGGVIFALELMLPQTYDNNSYWGCFVAGVIGALWYAVQRTCTMGVVTVELLPLISTNVEPGQGIAAGMPLCHVGLDVCLGCLCGLLGGLWVKASVHVARFYKWFRNRGGVAPKAPTNSLGPASDPLLQKESPSRRGTPFQYFVQSGGFNIQWRDLFLVGAVTALNTVVNGFLPLLGGKSQPQLMSDLFDRSLLLRSTEWAVLSGPITTMLLCSVIQWLMTLWAISLPTPTGIVAPTMIIGAMLGRCYGMLLPENLRDVLLTDQWGVSASEDVVGAFYARFAILGASAFCAAVCRAYAMAITVFEVLCLKQTELPLAASTLAAIFVANQVSYPFFDERLAARGLAGIPNITSGDNGLRPIFDIMHKISKKTECLAHKTTTGEIRTLLRRQDKIDGFQAPVLPIVQHLGKDLADDALLEGSIQRDDAWRLVNSLDPSGTQDDIEVDLMSPLFQRPVNGALPYVDGCPLRVPPTCTVKDVYLIMKAASGQSTIFVSAEGCILGVVYFAQLLTHNPETPRDPSACTIM